MNPIVHAELSWLMAQRLEARRDRVLVTCAGLAPELGGDAGAGGLPPPPAVRPGRQRPGLAHLLGATLLCLACALRYRRTPVELLSSRWDAEVVRTLRVRFLGEGRPTP